MDEFSKIDTDIQLKVSPPEFNLSFHNGSGEIGKLWWDDGQFKFKGDVDQSAQKFVEFVINQCQSWFEEKYGGNGGA